MKRPTPIPGLRPKSVAQRQKAKGRAGLLRTTSATAVRTAKRDNIIDCFCRALPNGVHSVPAVGRWSGPSCGGPARSPSSPPSCRPAQAGLRRGFGRRHYIWRACWPVPPHFALAPDVGRNFWLGKGKMQNTKDEDGTRKGTPPVLGGENTISQG